MSNDAKFKGNKLEINETELNNKKNRKDDC